MASGRDRPYWVHSQPDVSDQGQNWCSRGEYCYEATAAADGSGMVPAMTYRAYCESCTDHIGRCLEEMPGLYERLAAEIGEALMAEVLVRIPFGPEVPVRPDIDALMRLTVTALCSWEARVRATARLSPRDLSVPADSPASVAQAAGTLGKHLGVLLALQPGWMTQHVPIPPRQDDTRACTPDWLPSAGVLPPKLTALPVPPDIADELADEEIIRIGIDFVTIMTRRDGADAGLEILDLHHRARRLLRETRPKPAELPDFPCRECEHKALVAADPPWHDGDPDYYSRCANCRDLMTRDDYDTNAKRWIAFYRHTAERPVLEETPAA